MKLRVEDITAEAKELSFMEPQEDLNRLLTSGPIREYHVEGLLAVSVSYYRAGMELFFSGEVRAPITATCARCAEEFEAPSRRQFRFVLAPRVAGDTAQSDLRGEDLEFSLYEGDTVDLSALVREQMILALPTRPLCGEECRGLCPVCGENLNQGACDCRVEVPDPRLEVLRSLKLRRPAN